MKLQRYQHCLNFLKNLSQRGSQIWEVGLSVGNSFVEEPFSKEQGKILYSKECDPWMMFNWLKLYEWDLYPKKYLQDLLEDEDPASWDAAENEEISAHKKTMTEGEHSLLTSDEFDNHYIQYLLTGIDLIFWEELRQIDNEMKRYAEVILRNGPFMELNKKTLKEMFCTTEPHAMDSQA